MSNPPDVVELSLEKVEPEEPFELEVELDGEGEEEDGSESDVEVEVVLDMCVATRTQPVMVTQSRRTSSSGRVAWTASWVGRSGGC